MLTLIFRDAVVKAMKTFFRTILFASLMAMCANSYALSENEAEDMADLTAVFVFSEKRLWLPEFTQWANSSRTGLFCPAEPMGPQQLRQLRHEGAREDSYRDLSGIGIPTAKKCKALARDSLSLLAYVK